MVDESNHVRENFPLGSSHVDQRVGILVLSKDRSEEVASTSQDQLVRLDLLPIAADQGHIREVGALLQLLESQSDIVLEIVPFQMQLLLCTGHCLVLKKTL